MEYKISQLNHNNLDELLRLNISKEEKIMVKKHLNSSQGFIFGFFLEGELIGYSKYWYCDHNDPIALKVGIVKSEIKKTIYLNGTYVKELNRGHNVQRKIHQQVIPVLKYYGVKHILCFIPTENLPAKKNILDLLFKETIKIGNDALYIKHI